MYTHTSFFSFLSNYLKDQHVPFIRWFCSNFILKNIILKLLRPAFDNLLHLETNLSGNFKATFAFRDAIFWRAWLQPAAVWLPVAVWRSLWTLLHTCTELVACDWLVSFLYSKAIGQQGKIRTNGLQRLQMLYSRDEEKTFLFSQEVAGVLWPNDQDHGTAKRDLRATLESFVSTEGARATQVCQQLHKAAVSPPCATPLHVKYPSASSSYPLQHLR